MVLEKLDELFKSELTWVDIYLAKEEDSEKRHDIIWFSIQRCLGAADLAQKLGAPYAEVSEMYESVRVALMERW